jgi:hypothetical protein
MPPNKIHCTLLDLYLYIRWNGNGNGFFWLFLSYLYESFEVGQKPQRIRKLSSQKIFPGIDGARSLGKTDSLIEVLYMMDDSI